jgi:hypothetical protein
LGQTEGEMTPEQHDAVVELVLGRISPAEFVERTGLDPVARPEIIESELRGALVAQDADTVEGALSLAFRFDLVTADLVPLLAALLLLPWHYQHEDIASWLQGLRVPATADALAKAALIKHDYMDADDSHPFARKCIWALADIGTPEARAHLESLARADDTEIAAYAQRRLDKWNEELGRKGSAPRRK